MFTLTLRLIDYTLFFIRTINKNNEAQTWSKIKNNVRTIQAGIWNHNAKFTFLDNVLSFSSNSTASNVYRALKYLNVAINGISIAINSA